MLPLALWTCLWLGGQAAVSPDGLLERIRRTVSANLARLPNYTCRQTIERSVRLASSRRFKPVDTLRLEVAFVGGKELFAWPGAEKFEEQRIDQMVGGGTVGSGNFALHVAALFRTKEPTFSYAGENLQEGRKAIQYDFQVPRRKSGYVIKTGPKTGLAGYHGSVWVDAETLDLIRLEVHTDDIPPELEVSQVSDAMVYGRVRIGESDFLLPLSSELSMVDIAGNESRNRTRFDGCRQYLGQSVITFGEPVAAPEPTKQITSTALPTGLSLTLALKTPIDVASAAVGDPVSAELERAVKKDGSVVIPEGARLSGRITRVVRGEARFGPYYLVCLQLFTLEFDNHRSDFHGTLQDILADNRYYVPQGSAAGRPSSQWSGVPRHPAFEPRPGEGIFLVRGDRPRIPAGLRMVWRN